MKNYELPKRIIVEIIRLTVVRNKYVIVAIRMKNINFLVYRV
jgi:hypothetical protein